MLFLGNSDVLLDAKHRVAIPAKFRRNLDPEVDGTSLILVPGKPSHTIWLYPEKYFMALLGQAESTLLPGDDLREFDQMYFAFGEIVEPDAQGRILIPEHMIEDAGIGREAVISGVRNHLEIWPRDVFNKHRQEAKARFHEFYSRASESYRDLRRQTGQDDR